MSEAFHITLKEDQSREDLKRNIQAFVLRNSFSRTRVIQNEDLVSEIYEGYHGSAVHFMYSASGKKLQLRETVFHGGLDEAAEGVSPAEKVCDACVLFSGHDEQSKGAAMFTSDFIDYLNQNQYRSNY